MGMLALLLFGADFVLAALFDKLYQRARSGQTGGETNRYLAFSKLPTLLIMGNSRARYQVDPDSFAVPTYSLCHAGMGQVFQTGLLHLLEQENKLPSTVLLHVDFEEYTGDDNLEDIGNLRYYYGKSPAITTRIREISRYEQLKYCFRFYRYNGRVISIIKNFIQSRTATPFSKGYQALSPIANDSTSFVELTPPIIAGQRARFQYRNLRHLQEFLAICRRHKIKLLCFTSPYFVSRVSASMAALPIDSMLRAEHVPYFNAAAHPLPILQHHASFWQDADHLNVLGAGYLSQQIAQWSKPFLTADSTVIAPRH